MDNHIFGLQLVAGASAGAVTKTAVAPLERIKILFQVQGMRDRPGPPKYTGIWQATKVVVREEGFIGLYKGNGANVLRVIPVYALKFAFNDKFKDMVRKSPNERLGFWQLVASGSLAGLCQITLTYPLDVVRTRLSLSNEMAPTKQSITTCVTRMVKTEGWRSMYKGIVPTWLSGSPYVGLQMTFFELAQRSYPFRDSKTDSLSTVGKLICGSFAGLAAQTLTYPGDVVRRRMQANGLDGKPREYTTSWNCAQRIAQREGFRGFFSGLSANIVRCVPGAAIQFWAYETAKELFKVQGPHKK